MFRFIVTKMPVFDRIPIIGLAVATLLLSPAVPAQAQILSYDEILENLTGSWAVPFPASEDSEELIRDCIRLRIEISIETRSDGLYYSAEHRGTEAEGFDPHEQRVRQARAANGNFLPALLIAYENETRLDDDGDPVTWQLFMFTDDSFAWIATHWNFSGHTPIRTRCDQAPAV